MSAPTMWKPGTSKPPPAMQNNGPSPGSTGKGPKSGGGSAKKLSSSTMGMRFMQRKHEATRKEREERKEVRQSTGRRNDDATTDVAMKDESNRGDRGTLDRKRDSAEISEPSTEGVIILELASVVDMYGVGSDLVGRRSFGGFHKSVRSTWDAALKRRTDDDARAKNTRSHITDEELLERYEKYVKGRGGERDGGRGGGGGSGNRGRKDKRKRNASML